MLKKPLINVVELLLKKNKIVFDKQELAFQIQSHPSYPSLHSITGVLDHFNIENIAAEIPQNKETILELPNCFLAQVEEDKNKEIVTVLRAKSTYILYYSYSKKEKISELEFLKKFTGVIVAVENNEKESKQNFNYLNSVLVSALLITVVTFLTLSKISFFNILFFITSFAGVVISISIYKQELGINSIMGNAFCSSSNEKKDCDAVLSSKGATIYKNYKLGDLCLLYFASLFLTSFLIILNKSSINILYFTSIIAFPITFYSIYYQFIIVKKWCALCLCIVAVLWLQASFILFKKNLMFNISLESLLITFFSFLMVFIVWSFFKQKLKTYQKNKNLKLDFYKFKRNYNLFSSLLFSTKKVDTTLNNVPEIILGNKDSNLEIVIITNPFCGHCKPVHEMVENILKTYYNEVKIVIRFNISSEKKESDVVKISSRLLEIYEYKDISICLTAMRQIYEGESVVNWLKKWGKCYEKEKFLTILEKENFWCKVNGINFTPEILINGQSFPKEYDRLDLIYFIEELHEESNNFNGKETENKLIITT